MNLSMMAQRFLRMAERQSPTILLALGVTGIPTAVVLGVRATPNALYLLEVRKVEGMNKLGWSDDHEFSPIEVIKITWKCYIPTALMTLGSIGCILGSHSINMRRNAALAGLYAVSETALREYQEKVIEIIGKNKGEKIHDAIVQDKLDKGTETNKEVIVTGKGETLFYDSWSGRLFKSDIEKIRRAVNDLNYSMITGGDMFVPLNELYDALGLEGVEGGNHIGWSIERGQCDVRFTSKLTKDMEPCVVLEYKPGPKEL